MGQKAVTTVLLNMWLYHRNGAKGYINPGRAKIAKSTMVTEKTVSRTMAVLRDAGVLHVRRALHGEGGNSTEYTMDIAALMRMCGVEAPEIWDGELVEMSRSAAGH
jgi:DNA-binding transcriptional ArsR family regulator